MRSRRLSACVSPAGMQAESLRYRGISYPRGPILNGSTGSGGLPADVAARPGVGGAYLAETTAAPGFVHIDTATGDSPLPVAASATGKPVRDIER